MTAEGSSTTVEIFSSNDTADSKKAPMHTIMHLPLTADSKRCQKRKKKEGSLARGTAKGMREKFQRAG